MTNEPKFEVGGIVKFKPHGRRCPHCGQVGGPGIPIGVLVLRAKNEWNYKVYTPSDTTLIVRETDLEKAERFGES